MIQSALSKKSWAALGTLSLVAMLAVYSLLAWHQHRINASDTTIPTWSQLARGVTQMFAASELSGERWVMLDARVTALRLALGMSLGVSGAVALGILMGCFRAVEAIFSPPLTLLAKVPPTAALAVFFVMAGTDTRMYAVMIAFGILPTLAQAVYLAVRDVPAELIHKAYTLGASHLEVMFCIIARHCLPKILDAIRLQLGPALVYLIAAEMVCGDVGFGYRIRLQSRLLNMNVVYPYLAILAAFGFGADYALRRLRGVCCPWVALDSKA
jgi:NitT/TauT family transport system permease protein